MNLEFLYILTCFVTFACNLLDEVDGKFSQPLSLVKISKAVSLLDSWSGSTENQPPHSSLLFGSALNTPSGSDFVGIKHHFQPDLPVLLSNWQLLLSPTNRGHIKSTKSSLIGSNFSVSGPVIVMKSKDQEIEVMAKSLHKKKIILFPKLMGAS